MDHFKRGVVQGDVVQSMPPVGMKVGDNDGDAVQRASSAGACTLSVEQRGAIDEFGRCNGMDCLKAHAVEIVFDDVGVDELLGRGRAIRQQRLDGRRCRGQEVNGGHLGGRAQTDGTRKIREDKDE